MRPPPRPRIYRTSRETGPMLHGSSSMGPGDRFLGMEGGVLVGPTYSYRCQRIATETPGISISTVVHAVGGLTTYSVLLGVSGRSVADSRTLTGDGWTSNTLPVSLSARVFM